jgi:hypothetical protein
VCLSSILTGTMSPTSIEDSQVIISRLDNDDEPSTSRKGVQNLSKEGEAV